METWNLMQNKKKEHPRWDDLEFAFNHLTHAVLSNENVSSSKWIV